jgi:hypothetical protein
MKYVKILGLAAMALAALMALAGTASATTITSPKGTTYTNTIKAEASSTITLTSVFGGFGAISCKKSTVEGKVESHGAGVTAVGAISSLTYTECSNPVTVVSKGTLELHHIAGNEKEATLTSKNATITVHETLFGTCNFITSSTGTDIGNVTLTPSTGGAAVLDIKAQIPSENGCGTGTWEGTYKAVTPTTLYVDA